MKKLKVCAGSLLILMLLFFATVSWSFFTQSGTRFSLGTMQKSLKELSYTYESGNLANGINLQDVSWKLKNNSLIQIDKLSLKWNPKCWRGREFCLHNTQADRLTVTLAKPAVQQNPIVLKEIELPLTLKAKKLSITELVIDRPDKKSIKLSNVDFSGKLTQSTVTADKLSLDWNWLTVNGKGELRLIDNYPLSVTGTVASLPAANQFPVQGDFALSGDLLDTRVSTSLQHPFKSTVKGKVSLLTRRLPATLDIHSPQAQVPIKSPSPLLFLRNIDLHLTGFWPDYELTGSAETSGPQLPAALATLSGKINTYKINFESLSFETLNGTIDASGLLNFRDGITWNSILQLNNIEPHRHWPVADFSLSGDSQFTGRVNNGQSEFELSTIQYNGKRNDLQFVVTGSIHKTADSRMHIHTLEMNSKNNTATANGVISNDSNLSVYFSLREPSMLLPGASGDLNGELQITGNSAAPDIIGSASAAVLQYNNLTFENTGIKAQLQAKGHNPSQLTVVSESVNDQKNQLENIELKINGTLADHAVQTSFNNKTLSVGNSILTGSLDNEGIWMGRLEQTNGKLLNRPLALQNPFELKWIENRKSMALQPHCWLVDSSSACVTKPALLGESGSVNFSLSDFSVSHLQTRFPKSLTRATGTINSIGNLYWESFNKPKAQIKATIENANLEIASPAAQKPIDINLHTAELKVTTNQNKLQSSITIDSTKTGPVDATIEFDLAQNEPPLRGRIELTTAPLAWLSEYYPHIGINKGTLKSTINLAGTLSDPKFNGIVQLVNANHKSPQLPLPLRDIDLDISFANQDITILGKALTGSSVVQLDGIAKATATNWQADLNLAGDNISLQHEFVENATVSPRLNVKLRQNAIDISGKVHIPQANVKLPDLRANGIPNSKDVVIVDAVANTNNRNVNSGPLTVSADIDVGLGRNVTFQGYGLDADIHGDLAVQMKPQRTPELFGEIVVDSGTYKSYGQSLQIREGQINFIGPLQQTTVSVEAVRNTGSVLAGIRINGSLDAPSTDLFSEPALPEEDILPYLVLGRQMTFGGDQNSDSQLITRAALLMGLTNGSNLTNNIASNLGIEDFSMTALGSGNDTQVQLSGRLNDRLLVRYGLGVFNSVSTLFLRYSLAEQLYLETTQGLEKAVDVFYSFEFD